MGMYKIWVWVGLLFFTNQGFAKSVLGGLESIELRAEAVAGGKVAFPLEARIDTGATETSLDAIDAKKFDRAGEPYVRFRTYVGGTAYDLQAPFVKQSNVRSSNGMTQRRYFVKLEICLGSQRESTVVSLADRHSMRQPVLVGRGLLKGRYVVDVDSDHVVGEPHCN